MLMPVNYLTDNTSKVDKVKGEGLIKVQKKRKIHKQAQEKRYHT